LPLFCGLSSASGGLQIPRRYSGRIPPVERDKLYSARRFLAAVADSWAHTLGCLPFSRAAFAGRGQKKLVFYPDIPASITNDFLKLFLDYHKFLSSAIKFLSLFFCFF